MNDPPAQEVVRDIPREVAKELTGERREYCLIHCPKCMSGGGRPGDKASIRIP